MEFCKMAHLRPQTLLKLLSVVLLVSACTASPLPPRQSMPHVTRSVTPTREAPTAAGCISTDETLAVETATLKQRLMIAGFICDAADPYNDFVVAYRADLQNSDRTLLNLFRRLQGQGGDRGYDSFKTRVANISMRHSARDPVGYCMSAHATFRDAMAFPRKPLRTFVGAQDIAFEDGFSPCELVALAAR
jgi:hypothetical protein